MKRIIAVLLLAVALCQVALVASAVQYPYTYGGPLKKNGIATTKHQKKESATDTDAKCTLDQVTPGDAWVGYNMWYESRSNYVTVTTVAKSTGAYSIQYKYPHGIEGNYYGLGVKNHKNNGVNIHTDGTWRP
ncbi:hypothetical protein ACH6CV_02315 [Bacillota bacterium Meth-B3]